MVWQIYMELLLVENFEFHDDTCMCSCYSWCHVAERVMFEWSRSHTIPNSFLLNSSPGSKNILLFLFFLFIWLQDKRTRIGIFSILENLWLLLQLYANHGEISPVFVSSSSFFNQFSFFFESLYNAGCMDHFLLPTHFSLLWVRAVATLL